MKILGLEIKKIKKKDVPKEADDFSVCTLSDKCKDYLFGLKGGPFSTKRLQGYLHYDGIRVANNSLHFMWKDHVIVSKRIVGAYTGEPISIEGICGKQKVNFE